jgi:hypothetical protein
MSLLAPPRAQVAAHFNVDLVHGLSVERVVEGQRLHGKNELAPEPGAHPPPPCFCSTRAAVCP